MTNPILKDIFVGQNFMTPLLIGNGWIKKGKVAYELTSSRTPDNSMRVKPADMIFGSMFGVTVAIKDGFRWDQWDHEWNKVFQTEGDARNYINDLKEHFK